MSVELVVLLWIVSGAVGALIGASKERLVVGTVTGLALGPVGWLLVAVGGGKYACPYCEGDLSRTAVKCRHCGSDID